MLEIRKKGNKNFTHIATGYVNHYGANDITIIFDGNVSKLRSLSGRVIFDVDGYNLQNVTIYDDTVTGVAETYATIEQLRQRLINLGYPWNGSDTIVTQGIQSIQAGTNITVDNTDPENPIVSSTGGIPLEEEIEGTIVTMTGNIDWAAGVVHRQVLTAITTFTQSNFPPIGASKTIQLVLSGEFTFNLPTNWIPNPNNSDYNGLVDNILTATIIKNDATSVEVYYSLENKTA